MISQSKMYKPGNWCLYARPDGAFVLGGQHASIDFASKAELRAVFSAICDLLLANEEPSGEKHEYVVFDSPAMKGDIE